MTIHSFKDVAADKKHDEAREIREALFGQCRSILRIPLKSARHSE